jgi:hypothetical protein
MMKEYIVIGAVAACLLGTAAIVGLNSPGAVGDAPDNDAGPAIACPSTRTHIEASLHTIKSDGMYYRLTRKSVRTPIRQVIMQMRGKTRARETAISTRAFAQEKLAGGATGAEKRYYMDTILRAEALLAILDCMEGQRTL